MIKELNAAEAKSQTISNIEKNIVFQAIDSESKLGNFEVTIPSSYLNNSIKEHLISKGYKVEDRESRSGSSRGGMTIKKYCRVSWHS